MIDTKLLRQKILDLAIRGKLVPQDPKDEPASELLKKIKAEKDKHESFIFRGDDKRYYEQIDGKTADITDEIPFDLPDNWAWCRLANLASYKKGPFGSSITKAMFVPKGCNTYKVYEQKNAIQKNANIGDYFISEQKFNELKDFEVHPGDIIVSCAGTIGETFVLPTEIYPGIINQALMKIKLFASEIRDFYLLYFDYILKAEANEKGKGSAMKNIPPFDVLKKMLLPLPPLAEQQRIVEQIETLLGYVDIIDTDAETLEKSITLAKQKILDLAIRGKLVPQDPADEPASELLKKIKAEKDALVKAGKIKKDKHESFIFKSDDNCYHENIDGKVTDITEDIPFDLPDEWEWCRLSTISEFDLGKTLDRQKNTGNYRKYLRSVNVLWGNIDLSDVKEMRFEDTELERYSIKKGDLLICEGGDVGRCAVWDKDFVFYYQNALHRVRFYQKCISLFFQFVMMFFENTGLLKEISQGVTIKHLTKNTLNSMFFPLPPLAEQKRIVLQVEKLFTVLETMRG